NPGNKLPDYQSSNQIRQVCPDIDAEELRVNQAHRGRHNERADRQPKRTQHRASVTQPDILKGKRRPNPTSRSAVHQIAPSKSGSGGRQRLSLAVSGLGPDYGQHFGESTQLISKTPYRIDCPKASPSPLCILQDVARHRELLRVSLAAASM